MVNNMEDNGFERGLEADAANPAELHFEKFREGFSKR